MTPAEARRILALQDRVPPGKRGTVEDPYWVRSAVRYWLRSDSAEAGRRLAELVPYRERYAREGFYEGLER